jgi:hypothetical protein
MEHNIIDDHFLTSALPSLTDGEILQHYNKKHGDGRPMFIVPLFPPHGGMLSHDDVLRLMDQHVPTGQSTTKLLLIFLKPPNSDTGHFILCAEKPDREAHYIWWDSLNLSNTVLENHFGIPASEMFGGGSLFEKGLTQWRKNAIMAEARWATCGYWSLVWAHMLNTTRLEDGEKEIRTKLSSPILRDGGEFTEKNLRDPMADQSANTWKMLQSLIELNACMLEYYYHCCI